MLPSHGTKDEMYAALLPQIEAVIADVDDLIANLANLAAMLKQAFNFHWVGFYRTTAPHLLTLGPFRAAGLRLHSVRKRRLQRSRA
jgi:L-methionine (R)-S-oxide reductase